MHLFVDFIVYHFKSRKYLDVAFEMHSSCILYNWNRGVQIGLHIVVIKWRVQSNVRHYVLTHSSIQLSNQGQIQEFNSINLGRPWIRPRSLFSKIFQGLVFGWTLWYRPNLQSIALAIPEIIVIAVLGWGCEPQSCGRGCRRGSGMVPFETALVSFYTGIPNGPPDILAIRSRSLIVTL